MADDPKLPAQSQPADTAPSPDGALSLDGNAADTRPIDPKTGKPLAPAQPAIKLPQAPGEEDGPKGPEPTRYGDWERKGIVSDF